MRTPLRTLIGLPLAAILTFALSATPAHADAVEEMGVAVRQLLQPTTGASLVTPWASEAAAASGQYGYTTDLGAPFKAATKAGAGLTAVHRLWNAKTVDFTEALAGSSAYQSAMSAGYVDQGIRFYALAAAISGRTEPVNSYVKAGETPARHGCSRRESREGGLATGADRIPCACDPSCRCTGGPRPRTCSSASARNGGHEPCCFRTRFITYRKGLLSST